MNTNDKIDRITEKIEQLKDFQTWARVNIADIELSDDATIDLSAELPYFYVNNREDLQRVMQIAPRWDKSPGSSSIVYTATVDGVHVHIYAQNEALPKTCKVVREEVEVPARPAYTEIRERIVCDIASTTPTEGSN